jgi:hypothetical protein
VRTLVYKNTNDEYEGSEHDVIKIYSGGVLGMYFCSCHIAVFRVFSIKTMY